MAFVTDPDDLDRFQVCVDPVNERISIRGHGTVRVAKRTDGDVSAASTFDAAGATFQTSGVVAGDILTIVSGTNIGHYTVATIPSETQVTVNETFPDTAEAAGQTFRINQAASVAGPAGGNVGDGATLQSVYSFLKEEWRTFDTGLFAAGEAPDLIQFVFPLESITREQFEVGGTTHGDWDWKDDTTRNLIRTGGWAQIDSAGTVQAEYAGIITLGTLDSDAQVYYLQQAGGTPANFVLAGPVNQAVKTFTNGGSDFRNFLKLFVRKKKRTYAGSEIADIGVTSIETLVNRFPLAHASDPAISLTDGQISGDGVNTAFQSVATVDSAKTDGVSADADTTDGVFEFTSAGSLFQTTNKVRAGDTLEITSATDQGVYEIISVDSETALTLRQEPGVSIVGGSSLAFTTRTRYRSDGAADGTTADAVADDAEGEFTSVTVGDFAAAGVVAGDMLVITAATTVKNIGVYKIKSVATSTLTADITDNENWAAEGGATFHILRTGMHLQKFSASATQVSGVNITFADADPDTITRASGSFIADGYVHGMAVTVAGASNAANNGTFIVNTVAALTLTLIAEEALTAEGPSAGVTIDGEVGIVRSLNQVDYPFSWRLFGNGGTLAECFQFVQKQLRLTSDIDEATAVNRGDITDLLMSFASPTGTGLNVFIDDLAASDKNNATKRDLSGDNRNFAFLTAVKINLNQNILDAATSKVVVFFTDDNPPGDDTGADFGTVNAIIVDDDQGADMVAIDPAASPLEFTFDYDNNTQRGAGSGGSNAPITIVAIGTTAAQYVKTTGTIQRANENIFSLVAALERNFSNP